MWDEDLFWETLDDKIDMMWEQVFGPDDEPSMADHVPLKPTIN